MLFFFILFFYFYFIYYMNILFRNNIYTGFQILKYYDNR